jgi:hypothetical protein
MIYNERKREREGKKISLFFYREKIHHSSNPSIHSSQPTQHGLLFLLSSVTQTSSHNIVSCVGSIPKEQRRKRERERERSELSRRKVGTKKKNEVYMCLYQTFFVSITSFLRENKNSDNVVWHGMVP